MEERSAASSTNDLTETSSSTKGSTNAVATRICLVGDVLNNLNNLEAAKKFGIPIVSSETGLEFLNDATRGTVFVLEEFCGPVYDALFEANQRILGTTALLQYADRGDVLPYNHRPLFSLAMSGVVICITGFRRKSDLARMMFVIHSMGGSLRNDMSSKITHLVANTCSGEKYQYALTFGVPIVSEAWVHALWEARHDTTVLADTMDMAPHKLKVFHGARVCFFGFSDDECRHMTEVLEENGGRAADVHDFDVTIVVVDESRIALEALRPHKIRAPIVKAEWFWVSVQNEGCADEKEYLYEDHADLLSPSRRTSQPGTPASRGARKRKRLRDAVSRLVSTESPAVHKRRSSISDAAMLSMSGSYLDSTGDNLTLDTDEVESTTPSEPRKVLSPRQQVFLELVQTEANYVHMLQLVMDAKQELDDKLCDSLLNPTEVKIIFGNVPPIFEIHSAMLAELRLAASAWQEDTCVGRILLKYMSELTRAYPPFINFFEKSKDMLVKCDRDKVRFHAFLMGRQSRPDFCRQSVQDLLIRPVQRLPSISLLLNDILKHTSKSNADHTCLEKALSGIKEVMTYINEDKRKTEGQLAMFNIYNDIDQCPADLVSSHRAFIARCDVVELSDSLSRRGDHLVLFLFSDMLEVCKRRTRNFNSMKSPTPGAKPSGKPLKHVRLVPLPNIKRVIDVKETEDCRNVFALICRSNQELKERTFSFILTDDEADKSTFLNTLCRQTANTICKSDHRGFLMAMDAQQLDIDTSSLGVGTIGKAFKFARSRLKVTRAFSFNKTPLKRAVSTMINSSPFASTTNLTPASQLAQMRLASCSNLNELGGSPKSEGTYIAPMSVQPTRKNKTVSQSLSVAALRRI